MKNNILENMIWIIFLVIGLLVYHFNFISKKYSVENVAIINIVYVEKTRIRGSYKVKASNDVFFLVR